MKYLIYIILGIHLLLSTSSPGQDEWIETTQQDFADGIYERNIYASHRDGGTVEFVSRSDLNNDGYIDIIVSGRPVHIYWGSTVGYSPDNRTSFPPHGSSCDIADLDGDGYPDLLVAMSYHSRVYWGTNTGPDPLNYTNLPISGMSESCYIADLNKDGYLDIIVGQFRENFAYIFWGSVVGVHPDSFSTLPVQNANHNIEVADLNKDSWLDIVFVASHDSLNYIYWGSEDGYSSANVSGLYCGEDYAQHGSSIADLNSDGYLDIVFTGFVRNTRAYIYWGGSEGYTSYQILNTDVSYGGSSIADLNNDGYLDILFYRSYHGLYKPLIYWGSSDGYSDLNREEVGVVVAASGGFIADLNYDGELDIFVNNRISNGTSYIFWGGAFDSYTTLPCDMDHHGLFREIGNTYDRSYREDYISSIYNADSIVNWETITWEDSTPSGTSITMAVRSGNTPVPDPLWSSWSSVSNGSLIPEPLNSQYIQYKVTLFYTTPAVLPYLWEVRIGYGSLDFLILEPDSSASTLPNISLDYPLRVINNGPLPDIVNIRGSGTGAGWHRDFPLSTDTIQPYDTAYISVMIIPPENALYGDVDTTIITGILSGDTTMRDSAILITMVERVVGVDIEPNLSDSAQHEETIRYYLWVRNESNSIDCIDIIVESRWDFEIFDLTGEDTLIDTDDNGIQDVGNLLPDEAEGFFIDITSPQGALIGEADTAVVYARSSIDTSVRDSVLLITKIYGDIAPFLSIESDMESYITTGETKEYILSLLVGNVGDTLSLSFTPLPNGWDGGLYYEEEEIVDTDGDGRLDFGYISPLEEREITFRLTAPALIGYTDDIDVRSIISAYSCLYPPLSDSVFIRTHLRIGFDIYNYESPFRDKTTFVFTIPHSGNVDLTIYNRIGERIRRLVRNRHYDKGIYTEHWNGRNDSGERVSPGVYIYVLELTRGDGGKDRLMKKTILLR